MRCSILAGVSLDELVEKAVYREEPYDVYDDHGNKTGERGFDHKCYFLFKSGEEMIVEGKRLKPAGEVVWNLSEAFREQFGLGSHLEENDVLELFLDGHDWCPEVKEGNIANLDSLAIGMVAGEDIFKPDLIRMDMDEMQEARKKAEKQLKLKFSYEGFLDMFLNTE